MAGPAAAAAPTGKTVIKNIGMMLSGALENPILEADTLVAIDGKIDSFGKEKDEDRYKWNVANVEVWKGEHGMLGNFI